MGRFGYVFCVCALLLVVIVAGNSRCPPANKVYVQRPPCRDDYDCRKQGKICCPDQGNTKSCSLPAPYSNGGHHQQSGSSSSVSCEGVKCQPFEVCKMDPITKRLKCSRP